MRVIRNLTSKDCPHPLDFQNSTRHFWERVERLTRTCDGIGKVYSGFLVDKGHENGLEEHYITTTGIIVVRNHKTHKAVTVMIAREAQLNRYYRETGGILPHSIAKKAKWNCRACHYNY